MIQDRFGRPALNLRISVTQRCNMNCPYCHREGQECIPASEAVEMTATEIVRIAKIGVRLGLSRVKLTGGEPLLRKDILEIVEGISHLESLEDLSMTTNGAFLGDMARSLKTSGLMRVNVSLPSLKSDVYRGLMGTEVQDVLNGIKTAVQVGLSPVKLNMLVLSGVNEREIPAMIEFAREAKCLLQLIELEPVNISDTYYNRCHYSLNAIESDLESQAIHTEVRPYMQNRHIYHLPNGRVEVIRPIENTEFCAHCTRIRVTSDGHLKPCLMVNTNLVNILSPMRNGISDTELERLFGETCQKRKPYYRMTMLQKAKLSQPPHHRT